MEKTVKLKHTGFRQSEFQLEIFQCEQIIDGSLVSGNLQNYKTKCGINWIYVTAVCGVTRLLTSMPPANRENLEELECRQIWCSPGVCDVKVNLPSEPYCRDRITCRRHRGHKPVKSCWNYELMMILLLLVFVSTDALLQSSRSPCHQDLWLPQTSPDPEWPAGTLLSVYRTAESDSYLQRETHVSRFHLFHS